MSLFYSLLSFFVAHSLFDSFTHGCYRVILSVSRVKTKKARMQFLAAPERVNLVMTIAPFVHPTPTFRVPEKIKILVAVKVIVEMTTTAEQITMEMISVASNEANSTHCLAVMV